MEDILVTESVLVDILAKGGNLPRACPLARESVERARALHAAGGMTPKNWSEQQRILGRVLRTCP